MKSVKFYFLITTALFTLNASYAQHAKDVGLEAGGDTEWGAIKATAVQE